MKRAIIGVLFSFIALLVGIVPSYAAAPLNLYFYQAEIFRHVLEDDDWLVVGRAHVAPTSQTGDYDSFSVVVSSGDFQDSIQIVNRVVETGTDDWAVVADSTDITTSCKLFDDLVTIDCVSTGLGDATYDVTVTYRSGWSSYAPSDVTFSLLQGATINEIATVPNTGYIIAAMYFSAAQVTSEGLVWNDGTQQIRLNASPLYWDNPGSATASISEWHSTASQADTETELTAAARAMLLQLEVADIDSTSPGDYVGSSGITDAGREILTQAWHLFPLAIPEALVTSSFNPFQEFNPSGGTSFWDTITANAAATDVGLVWADLGTELGGVSGYVAGAGVFLILAFIASVLVIAKLHSGGLAFFASAIVMMVGVLLGAVHPVLLFLPVSLVGGYGLFRVFGWAHG